MKSSSRAEATPPPSEDPLEEDFVRLASLREASGAPSIEAAGRAQLLDLYEDPFMQAEFERRTTEGWPHLEALRDVAHLAPNRMFELFREDLDPATPILDFGCGNGTLANYKLDYDALPNPFIGIDLAEPTRSFPKNMRFFRADLHAFDWDGAPFERAISLHVFEHVPRPDELAVKLRSMMRQGGRALLAVPDCSTLHDLFQHVWARESCEHINAFTRQQFIDLVEAAGFRLVRQSLWPAHFSVHYGHIRLPDGRSLGALLDRTAADMDRVHGTTASSNYGFTGDFEAV